VRRPPGPILAIAYNQARTFARKKSTKKQDPAVEEWSERENSRLLPFS